MYILTSKMVAIMFYALCFIIPIDGYVFKVADEIEFKTYYYNDTYCNDTNLNYRTPSFKNVCFDDTSVCCASNLMDFSYLPNRTFNTCYTTEYNGSIVSYQYTCYDSSLDKMNISLRVLSILGIIFILFILIALFTSIAKCCTESKPSQYIRI